MSVSIVEVLRCAQNNLSTGRLPYQKHVGLQQLHNAVVLLEKGYDAETQVEPLLDKYGRVEDVPEFGGTDEKA